MEQVRYQELVKEVSPNSRIFVNCLRAFVGGGLICVLGEILKGFYLALMVEDNARLATGATLIFVAVLLTGLGWYDKLSEKIGAGATVPITGFANAVTAPAIEHKKEGYVLGVGAKMFIIAGPVILYGTLASMLVGLIYYFAR